MPRVVVTTEQTSRGEKTVLLDEQVHAVHLGTDHAAMQFIERLGWAITDAEHAENVSRGYETAASR